MTRKNSLSKIFLNKPLARFQLLFLKFIKFLPGNYLIIFRRI